MPDGFNESVVASAESKGGGVMNSKKLPIKIQLPEGFLDEEKRDGCVVTSELKALWAVELDLLAELDRVCKKHHLRYFANGGTLLGAARHGGFIPWDDDLDVNMPRPDYDKLCEVASAEFDHPYFFQTPYTDPGTVRGHAQLRNSCTIAVPSDDLVDGQIRTDHNQGIFLDIFPLDRLPDTGKEMFLQKIRAARSRFLRQAKYHYNAYHLSWRVIYHPMRMVYCALGLAKRLVAWALARGDFMSEKFARYEEVVQTYDNLPGGDYSQLTFDLEICFKLRLPVSCYETSSCLSFEFTQVPVPAQYEKYLELQYGDWRTPRRANSYHGGLFVDVSKSYKEYIAKV